MKYLFFGLFAIAFLLPACTTRYYIVRHAERLDDSSDSPLSSLGYTRADILRDSLQNKGITQIFASTLQRTQQTAQPLATALNLQLKLYRPDTTAGLIARLKKIRGKKVLVVGHSNTVPDLVLGLSQQSVAPIPETDFDNLYIVKITTAWGSIKRSLVQTTYGPATP
jgi:broad specificity phosphatase PhoE